jgi:hypothetical protein
MTHEIAFRRPIVKGISWSGICFVYELHW